MPQVEKGHRISGNGASRIAYGTGDPNSSTNHFVRTAGPGSLFLREDGGASTSLYVCTGVAVEASSGQTIAAWTAK